MLRTKRRTTKACLLCLSLLQRCSTVGSFVIVQQPRPMIRGKTSLPIPLRLRQQERSLSRHYFQARSSSKNQKRIVSSLATTDVSQEASQERPRRIVTLWSDFMYGAHYVHSRYLDLFWEYNIRRTLPVVVPVFLFLAASQILAPSVGSTFYTIFEKLLRSVFVVSSIVGGILQLPLDAFRWVCDATPVIVIPMLDYVPNNVAIHLVRTMLFAQHELHLLGKTPFVTLVAVLFWRPMLEEFQYRTLLNRLLQIRRKGTRTRRSEPDAERNTDSTDGPTMVTFIPVNVSGDDHDDSTNVPLIVETEEETGASSSSSLDSTSIVPPDESNDYDSKQRRIAIVTSLLFATTRLGWLCAHPDWSSPYIWNYLGFFLQSATSPYVWTVGFVQSAMTHLSSHVGSELTPLLQKGLMALAVQQSVSSFFVARHVFCTLYRQRGLAASVGAHVAWTVGKGTLPFRVLWKCGSFPSWVIMSSSPPPLPGSVDTNNR